MQTIKTNDGTRLYTLADDLAMVPNSLDVSNATLIADVLQFTGA
jgi:hypothetical protein